MQHRHQTSLLHYSPSEGCELKVFNTVLYEVLQISLADSTNGIDIGT